MGICIAPLFLLMELKKNSEISCTREWGAYRAFFFFHPAQIREILPDKSKLLPKFRLQVRVLQQWDGNGLLLSEGEFWARQRRLVYPAFQLKRLAGYADAMVHKAESIAQTWERLHDRSVIQKTR